MGGYAVASVWLAALFARTERCIAARSRLTERVLLMGAKQRAELRGVGTKLVGAQLPALLACIARVCGAVERIEGDIDVQVRSPAISRLL